MVAYLLIVISPKQLKHTHKQKLIDAEQNHAFYQKSNRKFIQILDYTPLNIGTLFLPTRCQLFYMAILSFEIRYMQFIFKVSSL